MFVHREWLVVWRIPFGWREVALVKTRGRSYWALDVAAVPVAESGEVLSLAGVVEAWLSFATCGADTMTVRVEVRMAIVASHDSETATGVRALRCNAINLNLSPKPM